MSNPRSVLPLFLLCWTATPAASTNWEAAEPGAVNVPLSAGSEGLVTTARTLPLRDEAGSIPDVLPVDMQVSTTIASPAVGVAVAEIRAEITPTVSMSQVDLFLSTNDSGVSRVEERTSDVIEAPLEAIIPLEDFETEAVLARNQESQVSSDEGLSLPATISDFHAVPSLIPERHSNELEVGIGLATVNESSVAVEPYHAFVARLSPDAPYANDARELSFECPNNCTIPDDARYLIELVSQSLNYAPDPVKILADPSCDFTMPLNWGIFAGEEVLWSPSCNSNIPVGPGAISHLDSFGIPGDNGERDGQADYLQDQAIDIVHDNDTTWRPSREAAASFRGPPDGQGVTFLVGDADLQTYGDYSAIVRVGDVNGTARQEILVIQQEGQVICVFTDERDAIHVTRGLTPWAGQDESGRPCGSTP